MKKFIGANWKLNYDHSQLVRLSHMSPPKNVEIFIAPPFPYLSTAKSILPSFYKIGAQNCSKYDIGAYTGEVSSKMLKDLTVEYVIIGHSERRNIFHETNEEIAKKLQLCYENQLKVVYCVGETLEQRKCKQAKQIVDDQLNIINEIGKSNNAYSFIDIAYEPVWAIGTGIVAQNEEITDMIFFIKQKMKEINIDGRIIYGGSVNQSNINELNRIQNLDGYLIGNASLSNDFFKIIEEYDK